MKGVPKGREAGRHIILAKGVWHLLVPQVVQTLELQAGAMQGLGGKRSSAGSWAPGAEHPAWLDTLSHVCVPV